MFIPSLWDCFVFRVVPLPHGPKGRAFGTLGIRDRVSQRTRRSAVGIK
jgi:hypothetical protein